MSTKLLSKLKEALNSGELYIILDNSKSYSDILAHLGFSKGTTKYVKLIRSFCNDNAILAEEAFKENLTPMHTKVCPICAKKFYIPKNNNKLQKQVTCSYSCANKYFRSGKDHPNYKSEDTYSKYHYREEALNNYGAKCNNCGYSDNELALDVHHIDEDRNNNELNNLIVLCANCHSILHRSKTS